MHGLNYVRTLPGLLGEQSCPKEGEGSHRQIVLVWPRRETQEQHLPLSSRCGTDGR